MPSDVDVPHQPLHLFLTSDQLNTLTKIKLDASNMYTYLYPLTPPPTILCYLTTISSTKVQKLPPLLDTGPPLKTPYLSTPPYISCRTPTSGHKPYPYPHYFPLRFSFSDPPHNKKSWNPPPPQGLGISLPLPFYPRYFMIYPQQNTNK